MDKTLFFGFAAALCLSFPAAVMAQDVPGETAATDVFAAASTVAVGEGDDAPVTDILHAVRVAKIKLERERLKRLEIWGGNPPVYGEFPARAEIVLAVWRKDAKTVNLYLADKQGARLWMKSPGAPPISVSQHAQVNSRYAIPEGHSATVVGVLYPVMDETVVSGRTSYRTRETVHVPISREMFVPDILTAGSDYLSFLVRDAHDEMARRGIRSRTYPDRLLSEIVDPYLIKSIVVIEHSGHQKLLGDSDPESVLGNFYVNLAVNGETAFDEAESSAGALGLAQFIPSTYALFVRNRPDLGLIPDFRAGMADHRNALIAEAAYFDDSLRLLPADLREKYLINPSAVAAYLAAAYNGGVTRVKRAYLNFGEDWDQYHGGNHSLRPETVTYVAKLRKVYSMMETGVYATPSAPNNAIPAERTVAVAQTSFDPVGTVCFGDGSCVTVN
ncbi:hypothetical protein JW899_04910 [Candidatus Uhrbacteria bacterium]|nr:hypothetical protein [Candidatus Uhrbacteria bacterium]